MTSSSWAFCGGWRGACKVARVRFGSATWGQTCSRALSATCTRMVEGRLARAARAPEVQELHTQHSSRPSESTRLKPLIRSASGQNSATTMLANALAAGAKNVDPAFRHHRQVVLASTTGCLGRHSRPRYNAGCAARLCGQAQPGQERPWCGATDSAATFCAHVTCGWAGARSLRGTSRPTMARRSTS